MKATAWAVVPHTDIEPGVEVRLNSDATIDEVIVQNVRHFHLEQMDDGQYWIGLNWTDDQGVDRMQHIMLTRYKNGLYPTVYT